MTTSHHQAIGRIGGLTRWSKEIDPKAATAPARKGFMARFEAEVPAEVTDPKQRAEMADRAKRAHMARLARLSAAKRRRRV